MLLGRGAAIDVRSGTGSSSLHWAAQGGEVQAVRLLLDNGADVNARNMFDETPSQLASGPKRQEIVKLLSQYGAEYVENESSM
jgi:ankyrin repeat protein